METVLKAISDWIKSLLTAAIMSNLNGLFDDVNTQVGSIAQQAGTKPSSFEPRVFAMIEALSRNVVLPIAGVILTFIACYELIQLITEHNNMAQFEPVLLMKWIFKTAISVWMISNTFDIIMAVFDVTQQVVANSSGIISGNTRVNDIGLSMLQSSMMQMDVGPLFGLFLQSFFIGITMRILSIVIFVIVYGRMIEIYMMVSLAPVPMATWGKAAPYPKRLSLSILIQSTYQQRAHRTGQCRNGHHAEQRCTEPCCTHRSTADTLHLRAGWSGPTCTAPDARPRP